MENKYKEHTNLVRRSIELTERNKVLSNKVFDMKDKLVKKSMNLKHLQEVLDNIQQKLKIPSSKEDIAELKKDCHIKDLEDQIKQKSEDNVKILQSLENL